MQRIGLSLEAQYDRPISQVIPLLKEAGFSAVSPLWSAELDFEALTKCVREHEMVIQSLHAPHRGVALLWEPDNEASSEVHRNILRSIDTCHAFKIPVLVMHCWRGHQYTFPQEPLDYRLFDSIAVYARDKGVCIALENLEGEEYLAALLTRYRDQKHVGFCWDSGHDHCYPHKTDFLASYGDRLMMTHLNDNWGLRDPGGIPTGKDDLHFIPGDGNLDWKHVLDRLQGVPRQEILNFELKLRPHSALACDLPYLGFSLEQFIALSGQRCREIAKRYTCALRNI